MKPIFSKGHVLAECPDCCAPTTFEYHQGGSQFGGLVRAGVPPGSHATGTTYYKLLSCAFCGRPGVATVAGENKYEEGRLVSFWPTSVPRGYLPERTPGAVVREYREAEQSMSVCAWRGAAALLRSALDKVLVANGYDEKDLYNKIEAAGTDGLVTTARLKRANELVCTLRNDVLHDEWREVDQKDAEAAHRYVGRIIEDLYDDRATVEALLREKGRLPG
jgi:hypothetical protein